MAWHVVAFVGETKAFARQVLLLFFCQHLFLPLLATTKRDLNTNSTGNQQSNISFNMDDYWKLEEGMQHVGSSRRDLVAGGYNKIPKRATLETLELEWERLQCGLLHYDACTTTELKRFIGQRRLEVESATGDDEEAETDARKNAKTKAPGRRQMINKLKVADEEPEFYKFTQLPPELQTYICELYMDFESPLETPTHPPLTRTCRHLRQMALPIFFSTQKFGLLYVEDYSVKSSVTPQPVFGFKLDSKSRSWLGSLSSADLACVKSISLGLQWQDDVSIDLDNSTEGFTVTVHDNGHLDIDFCKASDLQGGGLTCA